MINIILKDFKNKIFFEIIFKCQQQIPINLI